MTANLYGSAWPAILAADVSSDYQQRKESGRCTYPGCDQAQGELTLLCDVHAVAARARRRRSESKLRYALRKAKRCADCGKPSKQYRCPACRIVVGRGIGLRANKSEDKSQRIAARVAARTEAVDEHVADGYRRKRFRGQDRRGRQTNQQIDEQDLDDAIERLRRAKAGLALARSAEVQQLPRIQREEAKHEALSQADHGMRFVEEVLERNRYNPRKGGG